MHCRDDRLLERSADLLISWLLCIAAHYYAEDAERAYEIVCEAIRRFPENAALRIYAGDICRKETAVEKFHSGLVYFFSIGSQISQ